MAKRAGEPDASIPAVFVSNTAGLMLKTILGGPTAVGLARYPPSRHSTHHRDGQGYTGTL
jgi:hypothetical protein